MPQGVRVKIEQLRCESAAAPLGVDHPEPRLRWRQEADGRGQAQSAYQILVASTPDLLEEEKVDLWDSGKVISDQSIQIPYQGAPLHSRQICFWKVRIWDENSEISNWSEIASWEMALLQPEDWKAEWIGYPANWSDRALYFHRAFPLSDEIEKARLYISGLGYYEVSLNGRKVGDHILDPGWTDYSQRVLYATYDVASFLKPSDNFLEVAVGQGWYGMPKLRLQLEITYLNQRVEQIVTTGGHGEAPAVWFVGPGPIGRNSVYGGEEYDARLEQENGTASATVTHLAQNGSTEHDNFAVAMPVESPGGRMVSQINEPIRVLEVRQPVRFWNAGQGRYVFDVGQNLAGWVALYVSGPRGQRVTLRYAETLSEDGTINQQNLRKATAADHYILKGAGEERWEPRFTYHGFRYVQVEGYPGQPELDSLEIKVVGSSVRRVGRFTSSNEVLNRVEEAIVWSEKSNLHSVPTDCPQRDERLGWLNDMTVRAEEAIYHFEMERFLAKWCDDIADTQCPRTGAIADTAPFKWGKRPADPVAACYLEIPWLCHLHYGDTRLIEKHFDGMTRWVEFLRSQAQDGVLTYSHWGDWAPPAAFAIQNSVGAGAVSRFTPGSLVSTGFLSHHARLLATMADVIGKNKNAQEWKSYANQVQEAFNHAFWDEETGGYGSNNQAANALALHLRLVPDERLESVIDNLVADVLAHDGHLSTGNICTKYLLEALSEHGHVNLAYQIATKTTYPSWGYMLENGATTLWERWEHRTASGMNSHNHPMLGSIAAWFFKSLAGIRVDAAHPGFKRFKIHPLFPEDLDSVEASYECPYGRISSDWQQEADGRKLRVTVPPNTTALVRLPASDDQTVVINPTRSKTTHDLRDGFAEFELGPGEHQIVVANSHLGFPRKNNQPQPTANETSIGVTPPEPNQIQPEQRTIFNTL